VQFVTDVTVALLKMPPPGATDELAEKVQPVMRVIVALL
jgi:hypothetical protein